LNAEAMADEDEKEDDETASKWDLYTLKAKLLELGLNFDEVWNNVKDLIIKTIMSVEPNLASTYN
jgi:hypothetical protein